MNKHETLEYLDSHNIRYDIVEHGAVFNMEEMAGLDLPHGDAVAKNLFLKDDKRNYFLISVKGGKTLDLKEFRKANGTRRLSFANETDLLSVLALTPGSVTPLGLLNDENRQVRFFLDADFMEAPSLIGVHPNDNTATVFLQANDLADAVRAHGNEVHIVDLSPQRQG